MLQDSDEAGNRHCSTFNFLTAATTGARQFAHSILEREDASSIAKGNNRRAKAIVEQIQKHSYDVIVFQEAFQPRPRNIITKRLKAIYPHQTKVLNKKPLALKTNGGVMMISRHPIGEVKEIRYAKREGIDRMARKGALLAEVDLGKRKVQLIGTHLQAFGSTETMYAQYRQLHDQLLAAHEKPGVAQIVCGDFNTIKKLPPQLPPPVTQSMVERLARYDVMMKTLGTQDGDLVGEQQFTMDRPYNDLCKSRKEYRLLIDYCLLKPNGLQNINARRVVKIMRHPWHKKYKDLSDHFALEALLTFQ